MSACELNSSASLFGVFDDFIKNNLIDIILDFDKIMSKSISILKDDLYKNKLKENLSHYLADKIDVTAFMIWFVENYPDSFRILKQDPDYQYKFR